MNMIRALYREVMRSKRKAKPLLPAPKRTFKVLPRGDYYLYQDISTQIWYLGGYKGSSGCTQITRIKHTV